MAQRRRIRLAGGIWSWLALAVPLASLVIGGGQALAGPAAAKASPVRSQPSEPESVTVRVSAHSATVTWSRPAVDGGAPLTSYLVTATPDGASVRVGPQASRATITGLTNAFADVFAVTAINSAGMSAAGTFGPAARVISGTLRYPPAPASKPVPGDHGRPRSRTAAGPLRLPVHRPGPRLRSVCSLRRHEPHRRRAQAVPAARSPAVHPLGHRAFPWPEVVHHRGSP
jgi:Fibronectin type III domain